MTHSGKLYGIYSSSNKNLRPEKNLQQEHIIKKSKSYKRGSQYTLDLEDDMNIPSIDLDLAQAPIQIVDITYGNYFLFLVILAKHLSMFLCDIISGKTFKDQFSLV